MASRLTELERSFFKVCNVCGNIGFPDALAICQNCREHAEHIYCMKIMADEILQEWYCAKCSAENLLLLPKKANFLPLPNEEVPVPPSPKELDFLRSCKGKTISEPRNEDLQPPSELPAKKLIKQIKRSLKVNTPPIAAPELGNQQAHTMSQTPASVVPGESDELLAVVQEELKANPCADIFSSTSCWKGEFEISGEGTRTYSGVLAFLGIDVASQVREFCRRLPETLQLQIKPQRLLLPKRFQCKPPDHKDIAVCFSCEPSWQDELNKLVVEISSQGNAMVSVMGDTKVLIFASDILPEDCRTVKRQPFFWAVIVQKRAELLPPSRVLKKENENCEASVEAPVVHCRVHDMDIDTVGEKDTSNSKACTQIFPEVPPGFPRLPDKNLEE